MANLTASAVTVLTSWTEGEVTGKRYTCLQVQLVLTGQGLITAGSQITANVLGLDSIISSTNFVDAAGDIYVTTPDQTGAVLIITSVIQLAASEVSQAQSGQTDLGIIGTSSSGVTIQGVVKGPLYHG
jgi:hypothetical protein